jgi:hypothetical protein
MTIRPAAFSVADGVAGRVGARVASRVAIRAAGRAAGIAALCAAAAIGAPALAQDRADIDRTRIIGNRELPKVLYIVPWKKPLTGELAARPSTSVLDEALAPVDRDVFRRQIQYDGQWRAATSGAATPPTPTAGAAPAAK